MLAIRAFVKLLASPIIKCSFRARIGQLQSIRSTILQVIVQYYKQNSDIANPSTYGMPNLIKLCWCRGVVRMRGAAKSYTEN